MKPTKRFILTFRADIPIEATSKEEARRIFNENKQVIVNSLVESARNEIETNELAWKKIRLAKR